MKSVHTQRVLRLPSLTHRPFPSSNDASNTYKSQPRHRDPSPADVRAGFEAPITSPQAPDVSTPNKPLGTTAHVLSPQHVSGSQSPARQEMVTLQLSKFQILGLEDTASAEKGGRGETYPVGTVLCVRLQGQVRLEEVL